MNKVLSAGAALLMSTGMVSAAGLDRSGQPVGAIFEDGNYVEFSFGLVTPDVTGEFNPGAVGSGNMAESYTSLGFAFKTDINRQVSLGVIFDQPFGANVSYEQAGYPLNGTNAEVTSTGITVLGRYKVNDAFSVHGGVRMISASGDITLTAPAPYASDYSQDTGLGYVIGAAYERPDIALRVAMTYSSSIDMELDGSAGDLSTTLPQSVNLDFQTGIAADTLLFGSIRWADWSETVLLDSLAGPLVTYDNDGYTYNIGVGRRFSDQFSGSVSIGYEKANGGTASNLSPTDGFLSLQLGGAYTLDSGVEISGGVRYVWLGDATTDIGPGNGDFEDNTAIGVGVKVAYSY